MLGGREKRVWAGPLVTLLSNSVPDSSSFTTEQKAHHADPYDNLIEKGSSQQAFWFRSFRSHFQPIIRQVSLPFSFIRSELDFFSR